MPLELPGHRKTGLPGLTERMICFDEMKKKGRKTVKTRFFAWVLAVVMIIGMLPMAAFAKSAPIEALPVVISFKGLDDVQEQVKKLIENKMYFTFTVDGEKVENELWLEEFFDIDEDGNYVIDDSGVYSAKMFAYPGTYTVEAHNAVLEDYVYFCKLPENLEVTTDSDTLEIANVYKKSTSLTITKRIEGLENDPEMVKELIENTYFTFTVDGEDAGLELRLEAFCDLDENDDYILNDDGVYSMTISAFTGTYTVTEHNAELKNYKLTRNLPVDFEVTEDGYTLEIKNTYKKDGHPIYPVAPTLNKGDHVAYVVGYSNGNIGPMDNITRAEAAMIFYRLLDSKTRKTYETTFNSYSDVKPGDWFNEAVSTLSAAGIFSGYTDGTFRPTSLMTRAEMAKVISAFADKDKTSSGSAFVDVSGNWAEAYINLAAGNGWVYGNDGYFRPDDTITRAETITMINRVLERVPASEKNLLDREDMVTFPDNKPGEWYYIAIQEAANSHTYERKTTEKNGNETWVKIIKK